MSQFFQKLQSLLHIRSGQQMEEATFNEILDRSFSRLSGIDPETHQQWLHLQRAITQREAEVALRKSRLVPRFALGFAGIVVAFLGLYFYFSSSSSKVSLDTIVTGRGEQKEVVLDDGSRVTLNHTTKLVKTKLEAQKPRRVLLAGEAYFRVQHGETRFIVSTEYAEVEVMGTEFNLRARGGALEVAVISGMVNVSAVKDGKDSTLLLRQHQMALVPHNDFPRRIGDIPSPEYPGWMHGKLFLNRTSFLEAVREIEMRFDVTIAIHDPELGEKIITGILDAGSAEAALTALCELTRKKFTYDGYAYTVH